MATLITINDIDIISLLQKHYTIEEWEKPPDNETILGDYVAEPDFSGLYETNITSLLNEESNRYVTFLDPHQSTVKMWITMIDFVQEGPLPLHTNMPCWWCRDTFVTCPIGAPIYYHSNKTTGSRLDIIINNLKKCNLPSDTVDFFETEGIFCSFPCVKAYISEELKKGNIFYKDSPTLFTLLYLKLYKKVIVIDKAASWKIIDKWGGHLPIDHYRGTYCKLHYTTTCNAKRPYMYSIGSCIEELKCF